MYYPGMNAQYQLNDLAKALMNNEEFKKEISNYIRLEIQSSKNSSPRQNTSSLSYDMLTRGTVNMQARMAANGYDVYGKTIISSNQSSFRNDNHIKKMKNKINYGSNPADGKENRGSYKIV